MRSRLAHSERTRGRPKTPTYADPIIDVHMHCYSKTEWEEENHPNPVTGKPLTARNNQDHFRETVAAMKKYNIVQGMVSNNYAAANAGIKACRKDDKDAG